MKGEDLENHVLDFDSTAAASAAALASERHKAGRPSDLRDTLIAGIGIARHATSATRNVRHVSGLRVAVVDRGTDTDDGLARRLLTAGGPRGGK